MTGWNKHNCRFTFSVSGAWLWVILCELLFPHECVFIFGSLLSYRFLSHHRFLDALLCTQIQSERNFIKIFLYLFTVPQILFLFLYSFKKCFGLVSMKAFFFTP